MADLPSSSDHSSPEPASERWSFAADSATVEAAEGSLLPEMLLVDPRQAALDARWRPEPGVNASVFHEVPALHDITAFDDRGRMHALRVETVSGSGKPSRQTPWPVSMRILVDPVPARAARWLELRGRNGTTARLLPSARGAAQVAPLKPASASQAEQELSELALSLIALSARGDADEVAASVRRRCSFILARSAELRGSGELDATSDLPGQLTRLCAVLTEQSGAVEIPPAWSSMLAAAKRHDGPRYSLDLDASLPPVDGVTVLIDSVLSLADGWRLYLRAIPGWWRYSEDRDHKRSVLSVSAEDDRGGSYTSTFGGSKDRRGHEEIALQFLPRLDPAARAVKLTVRGAIEEVPVAIGLGVLGGAGSGRVS